MNNDNQRLSPATPSDTELGGLTGERRRLFERLTQKGQSSSNPAGGEQEPKGQPGPQPPKNAPRLVRMKRGGARPPFFCVHALLGSVFPYHKLALHMPDDWPFYGVESSGLDGKETPHETIEEMAASYLRAIEEVQPDGPLHLGGYSFGGLVAYDIARLALEKGRSTRVLAILGVGAPFKLPAEWEKQVRFATDYFEDFQKLVRNAYLAEAKPDAPPPFDCAAFEAKLPPMQRVTLANLRAQVRYTPGAYAGGLDVFITEDQEPFAKGDPSLGWKAFATGPIEQHVIGGNHLSIFEEPQVRGLAKAITKCLERP